jgi:hypothetical protein
METIGALAVKIGADASELVSELGKAGKALTAHEFSLMKVGKAAFAFGAAAAAVGGTIIAFSKTVTAGAEEVGKLSEKIGVTVESMSTLKYAAYVADISMEELAISLRFLNKTMAEAQTGSQDLRALFKVLKVEFESAPGVLRATDDVLIDLAERFYRMEDGANKTAIAIKLFGRAGSDLIPFLNLGRGGIEKLKDEARKLGIELDSKTTKSAQEFHDAIKKLWETSKAAALHFAGPFVESQTKAMNAMLDAKKAGEGFFAAWKAGMSVFLFGTQMEQWQKSMESANAKLVAAKNELAAAEAAAKTPNAQLWPEAAAQSVAKYVAKVQAAQAEVDKLTSQKPKDPEEESPPKKKKGPEIPDGEKERRKTKMIIDQTLEDEERLAKERIDLQTANDETRDKEIAERKAATEAAQANDLAVSEAGIARIEDGQRAAFDRKMELKALEFKTEEDLENEQYKKRLARLEAFTDEELDLIGGRAAQVQQINDEHTNRMNQIQATGTKTRLEFEKSSWQRQAATVFGELENMTAGVAQHNRAMFEINKVASIANAIINTATGVTRALSAYPPPLSFVMAAAQAAAGLVQIQAIRSTQFGSGGAAPSAAATPAPPVTTVENNSSSSASGGGSKDGMVTIVNLPGTDLIETKAVRGLLEKLNEGMRDGGRIIIQ